MTNSFSTVGRLTRDPELKSYGQNGGQLASFSLAIDVNRGNDTLFVDGAVFGQRAQTFVNGFTKGMPVYVKGELQPNSYNKQDGTQVNGVQLNVDDFDFVLTKAQADAFRQQSGQPAGGAGGQNQFQQAPQQRQAPQQQFQGFNAQGGGQQQQQAPQQNGFQSNGQVVSDDNLPF